MLKQQITAYLPSLVVPALVSFAAVYIYTRLLSAEAYGYYALSLNAMTVLGSIGFYWVQSTLPRLLVQDTTHAQEQALCVASYVSCLVISLLLLLLALLYASYRNDDLLVPVLWMAVPLALARGLLNVNQSIHKAHMQIRQYNLLECGQALLGLGVGVIWVLLGGTGWHGAIGGMFIALVLMNLCDLKVLRQLRWRYFSLSALPQLLAFGGPLIISFAFSSLLTVADRFLLGYLLGPSQLATYAVGYVLVDRIMALLFLAVATPAYPLSTKTLEQEGQEAAQRQTYHTGIALLALVVPACVGLIMCSDALAEVMIGNALRAGALQVMPWIALSSLLGGLATHYMDHAFYLSRRTHWLMVTQGGALLLNLLLNLLLIPRYGVLGSAYANLASYATLLALSISLGRRVFLIHFPLIPGLKIVAISLVMGAVIQQLAVPMTLAGLAIKVISGGIIYALLALGFNIGGIRSHLPFAVLQK